jgi:hypothetical protein
VHCGHLTAVPFNRFASEREKALAAGCNEFDTKPIEAQPFAPIHVRSHVAWSRGKRLATIEEIMAGIAPGQI